MDQNLLDKIREARERIENRGAALRTLIEIAEPGRQNRAAGVLTRVEGLTNSDAGVTATVPSEDGKNVYSVSIALFRRPGGQEVTREQTCTCYDNRRSGSCKHIIAVAAKWIRTYHADWKRLKAAEAILTPGSSP